MARSSSDPQATMAEMLAEHGEQIGKLTADQQEAQRAVRAAAGDRRRPGTAGPAPAGVHPDAAAAVVAARRDRQRTTHRHPATCGSTRVYRPCYEQYADDLGRAGQNTRSACSCSTGSPSCTRSCTCATAGRRPPHRHGRMAHPVPADRGRDAPAHHALLLARRRGSGERPAVRRLPGGGPVMAARDPGERTARQMAQAYAERAGRSFRWRPAPSCPRCRPRTPGRPAGATCKGECGRLGHGFHDATTDPGVIDRWWGRNPDCNVGIATGAPGPDVLDIDVHQDGNGFAALNRVKRAGLADGQQAIVRTPSTGFHLYYNGTGQRNGSIRGQHIDFRARAATWSPRRRRPRPGRTWSSSTARTLPPRSTSPGSARSWSPRRCGAARAGHAGNRVPGGRAGRRGTRGPAQRLRRRGGARRPQLPRVLRGQAAGAVRPAGRASRRVAGQRSATC